MLVLGSGMINFGLPSQLKAWFDHITWPGETFGYSEAGGPQGLLTDKKVYLVTASGGVFSGGDWSAFDFQTGYLRHLLGFIGLTDVEIVRVEGTVFGPEAVKAAIAAAETQVRGVLERRPEGRPAYRCGRDYQALSGQCGRLKHRQTGQHYEDHSVWRDRTNRKAHYRRGAAVRIRAIRLHP